VNTYSALLSLPFIKSGYPSVIKFVQTTMMQHDDHRKAFQAHTAALNGTIQDSPNARYNPSLTAAVPGLKTALDVVKLAATVETVARDTYLSDLAQFADSESKRIVASVLGVESQHLATLRAMTSLLEAGSPELMAFPIVASVLPAVVGSTGFTDGPFPMPTMPSPPSEGAVT
jgi:hypothetical protein